MNRDPHQALKSEIIAQARSSQVELILARLQWSKNEIGYSLHVNPFSYSSYGLQATDFLSSLGFHRSRCAFMAGRQCFVRWVDEGFDLGHFGSRFDAAYASLTDGARDLESCGFFLEQPEGWGYFYGKSSGTRARDASMSADGHTAMKIEHMKESDDANFMFKFTWLEMSHQRGWVIHYRPKHLPLSSEVCSVFEFLRLKHFDSCPEFDFEECYWRSIGFVSKGDSPFDTNAQAAHQWFDAHATRFSPGIEKLLSANAMIEETGLRFLPFAKPPEERLAADIEKKVERPKGKPTPKQPEFDVAISFAGAQRELAEALATVVRSAGFSVFYDGFYPEQLWGKNLADYFDDVFRKRAKHCVIFVSKEYKESNWTDHERRSAQARGLSEKGGEYLLPIKVDDTELDGMAPTIGYVPISRGIDEIAKLLIKKLQG